MRGGRLFLLLSGSTVIVITFKEIEPKSHFRLTIRMRRPDTPATRNTLTSSDRRHNCSGVFGTTATTQPLARIKIVNGTSVELFLFAYYLVCNIEKERRKKSLSYL